VSVALTPIPVKRISVPAATPRLLAFVLLAALVVACSDDSDEQATTAVTPIAAESPGAVKTPGAVLTPMAGVVVDIETAKRYEAGGDIEAAAAAYIAIAAKGASHDHNPATLAAARLLMALDRYEDASILLEPFVEDAKPAADALTGRYLLGRAYSGLDRWQESVKQFDKYIAGQGPATPYAYLDRSYALLEMERASESVQSVEAGLAAGVPDSAEQDYLLAIAESYERAANFPQAIAGYRTFIDQSGIDSDVAHALERIVALKKIMEDPTETAEMMRLLTEYPATSQALNMLNGAVAEGDVIPPNVQGLIYYRHNDYTAAEPHFQEQIDTAPDAPETAMARYYLAVIQESKGDIDAALANYNLVPQLNAQSPSADDALWWVARILEQRNDISGAQALYQRIVAEYPTSQFYSDASFRRGMLPYLQGQYNEAAAAWEADTVLVTKPADQERLRLWQAKAFSKAGNDAGAKPILDGLAQTREDDYFGIRANGLRDNGHEQPNHQEESNINLTPNWDWASAEKWLSEKTGAPATAKPWQTDNRWVRAQELWKVGRQGYADLEVADLIESNSSNPAALYTLSRELLSQGQMSMSGRVGQRLLLTLDSNPNQGLPKAIMSLSYPAASGPLVERYAEAEGISPLLLLAFIRQESFFDPRAVSPANALGLTQVLPDTAQTLALGVGVPQPVQEDQLLHAELNLRLGARYMADQLKQFGDEIFVALAAYNAGPSAAERWRAASGDDADVYVETVEFAETRLYLEIVSENYAAYRYIYTDATEPNLPR
jgi:soluble lytic murein transglycosylase-like protein